MSLQEQFDKSKKLAEYAEQLVRERKELDRVLNHLIAQVKQDITHARGFLEQFEELRQQYIETLKQFTDQLEHL